jgi:hypothetical protein
MRGGGFMGLCVVTVAILQHLRHYLGVAKKCLFGKVRANSYAYIPSHGAIITLNAV